MDYDGFANPYEGHGEGGCFGGLVMLVGIVAAVASGMKECVDRHRKEEAAKPKTEQRAPARHSSYGSNQEAGRYEDEYDYPDDGGGQWDDYDGFASPRGD